MIISFKIQELDHDKNVINLLSELDSRISFISKTRLDALRYGVEKSCGKHKEYSLLIRYKKILLQKMSGSRCLCKYNLEDLVGNIKQYLASGKIQKFKISKNTKLKPGSGSVEISTENNPLPIVYTFNDYGDNVVYNSSFYENNYTTINEGGNDQLNW
jgi:hypothetical protein